MQLAPWIYFAFWDSLMPLSWCSKFLYNLEDVKRVPVLPTFFNDKLQGEPQAFPMGWEQTHFNNSLLGLQSLCNWSHTIHRVPFSGFWICGDDFFMPNIYLNGKYFLTVTVQVKYEDEKRYHLPISQGMRISKRVPTTDFCFLALGSD